jgi:hypothetical protein
MKNESLNSVFRSLQCYQGDQAEGPTGVTALCSKLIQAHLGVDPPADAKAPWDAWIARYLTHVSDEREHSHARTLFQDHFHNVKAATTMEGDWFAKWTAIGEDGSEQIFEVDSLFVWTTSSRIRMVGTSVKQGRETLSTKSQEAARFYPMEGVVSRSGWVALAYWSGGGIPICGTTLLVPKGSSGELLEGTWQGYTAANIQDAPAFTRGRVVVSRNRALVERYWTDLSKT